MLEPGNSLFFFFLLDVFVGLFFWLLSSFLAPQLSSSSPSPCYEISFDLLPVTRDQAVSTHPQVEGRDVSDGGPATAVSSNSLRTLTTQSRVLLY